MSRTYKDKRSKTEKQKVKNFWKEKARRRERRNEQVEIEESIMQF